jgi:hypothetical protein
VPGYYHKIISHATLVFEAIGKLMGAGVEWQWL